MTKSLLAVVLFAAFAMLFATPNATGFSFEVYGYAVDTSTQNAKKLFSRLQAVEAVHFYDASQRKIGKLYQDLTNFVTARCDVPLLPKSIERRTAPPFIHNQNRDRYYVQYLTPLVGIFYAEELVAVVVGQEWYGDDFWYDLVSEPPDWSGLLIYTLAGEHHIDDIDLIHQYQVLFESIMKDSA